MKKFFSFTLLLLLAGGGALYYWSVLMPHNKGEAEPRMVKIPPASGFMVVGDSLLSAGVIQSKLAINIAGVVTGLAKKVQPGMYHIDPGSSNRDVLEKLASGKQTPIRVTVPPGTRPGVLAAILRRDLEADSLAVVEALANPELLEDWSSDQLHAFGSMLPETYHFNWGTSVKAALSAFNTAHQRFFNEERVAAAERISMTPNEVTTLASIVEWEARLDEEKPAIAGVYLNRLSRGMLLQADPTVQYAIIKRTGGTMRPLLFRDLKLDDPFNTYVHPGLPPGPINNPSPSSIDAVLNAEKHDYLFFVADGTGRHTFSRTFQEHVRRANVFRRKMAEQRRNPG